MVATFTILRVESRVGYNRIVMYRIIIITIIIGCRVALFHFYTKQCQRLLCQSVDWSVSALSVNSLPRHRRAAYTAHILLSERSPLADRRMEWKRSERRRRRRPRPRQRRRNIIVIIIAAVLYIVLGNKRATVRNE